MLLASGRLDDGVAGGVVDRQPKVKPRAARGRLSVTASIAGQVVAQPIAPPDHGQAHACVDKAHPALATR